MIRFKAKELAKQINVTEFVGGLSWCNRFMRRNKLSVLSRTTVAQKLPRDWEERVTNFRQFVSRRKDELNIQADRVFNMDEVPMSFDAPYSRTVDTTGGEYSCVNYRSRENRLHCCTRVFRVREKAETDGHLQTKSIAQREPSHCCSCPLPQQRMDG